MSIYITGTGVVKNLSYLLQFVPQAQPLRGDAAVTSVIYNSRQAGPGSLFVAIPGLQTDGHRYLGDAVRRGAAAVVVQQDQRHAWEPFLSANPDIVAAAVPDSRRALADLAAAFYDFPARRLRVIGVTGTDGKTTTTYLISHLLEASGRSVGLVGTVGIRLGARASENPWHQTTPESPQIQELLATMVTEGVEYAVIESTSHGLALHRLDHCEYDVAVFTNLSDDHLDFHGTRAEYLRAKGRLFEMLDEAAAKDIAKTAVLNADDPASTYLSSITGAQVIRYGLESPSADLRAESVQATGSGLRFRLIAAGGQWEVTTRLIGRFNVYNCLAALAAAIPLGIDMRTAIEALGTFAGVPGRMQRIDAGQPFNVIVDFAHTPNALRNALQALRPLTSGRLVVLFGSAGERDEGRRSGMGRVAAELADFIVISSDDPRSEDPERIIDQIAAAVSEVGRQEGRDFVRIADRRQAIAYAFNYAREGDTVLLAGKGHESSMLIGNESLPWNEAAIAREILLNQ